MNKRNLGGHSGCQIFLIEEDDGKVFVRKISKDKYYNDRLKTQCEKQASFLKDSIKAPKVYSQGYTDEGLYFFDMEYVQGITLAKYIKTMEIGKIKDLVEALTTNLVPKTPFESTPETKTQINKIFKTKFSQLRTTLKAKNNDVINKSLDLLENHDWSKMAPTACHGDMTLENIIIKNDKMYFIDFLDSFYDSWVLDIGTLLQDIQVMWSYRFEKEVDMNTVLRLLVFRDLLIDEIKKINPDYTIEVYYALLQKLLRIYPYVNDELTYNFLNEKNKAVIDNICQLEKSVGEEK